MNPFEDIKSIICDVFSRQHFEKYCPKVKQNTAWWKSCNEEVMSRIESLNSERVG
jgi:hypothetical protein